MLNALVATFKTEILCEHCQNDGRPGMQRNIARKKPVDWRIMLYAMAKYVAHRILGFALNRFRKRMQIEILAMSMNGL